MSVADANDLTEKQAVCAGPDPAGTPMAVYAEARKVAKHQAHSLLRALAIEDRDGIAERGPLVAIVKGVILAGDLPRSVPRGGGA